MNWLKEFIFEKDLSLFQVFMITMMFLHFPLFDSVLNFVINLVWAYVVGYINYLVLDNTNG